ncbi:hypothetical protein Ahy_A05g023560 isoform C [Arachis hypogaea]|uniref:Uncharacterized protein n=1 Tax=Arachis hypogaea TaxID=3818 RepID=A0A445D4D4_ARAHY|nr:hypothetical protein Ahy_A05g023560 isoform C [Arachis hypogaea]
MLGSIHVGYSAVEHMLPKAEGAEAMPLWLPQEP